MQEIQDLKSRFSNIFNKDSEDVFFSPGRVNIIGEHIDYNGGSVFPAALSLGTYGVFAYRNDDVVRVYSENFKEEGMIQFTLSEINEKGNNYCDYVKAIIVEYNRKNYTTANGFDLYILGTIPNGSGLSSSASLELLISEMIIHRYNYTVLSINKAIMCCNAERDFIGVNCGIMDQFAIAMGKKDSGILLSTSNLAYHYVPLNLKDYCFVIMNTNKKRQLSDSKYNERRSECEEALAIIKQEFNVDKLCQLKSINLTKIKKLLNNETLYKRVFHCVSEQSRVQTLVKELKEGNLEKVGQLMTRSHQSLAENYEVTGPELDWLVSSALTCKGVLGARMTGAGFGGCAIALVESDCVDAMIEKSSAFYNSMTGLKADYFVAEFSEGTHLVK